MKELLKIELFINSHNFESETSLPFTKKYQNIVAFWFLLHFLQMIFDKNISLKEILHFYSFKLEFIFAKNKIDRLFLQFQNI